MFFKLKRSNHQWFWFQKGTSSETYISQDNSGFQEKNFSSVLREKVSFLWHYLIRQIPSLQSPEKSKYSPTHQDIFVYLNSLDYCSEYQTLNGRPINSFISPDIDDPTTRPSKKQIILHKVVETPASSHYSNRDFSPTDDSASLKNPFLTPSRVVSKREEFTIQNKMAILAVLGPLPKSPFDFEMTSAEVNHLSAESHRISKQKSFTSRIFKFLNMKSESFESKNPNSIVYCLALRFVLREQVKALLRIDHRFLENFIASVGPGNFFFQRLDCSGIGSILCFLKNDFIYRSENKDFARDLFNVVSNSLDFYWR